MPLCTVLARTARYLVLFALLVAAVGSCKDDGYANSPSNGCLDNEDHSSWMANIPSRSRLFRDLTLPGTHDTGSYKYYGLDLHRTQCSSVEAQLKAGVRVFDMRLAITIAYEPGQKVPKKTVALLHGTPLTTAATFVEVWNQMTKFLAEHPTEVIVAIVRNGYGTPWDEDMVEEHFNRTQYTKYRDTSCLSTDCAIGPSRGKIVYLAKDEETFFLRSMDYYRVVTPTQNEKCNTDNSDNLEDHSDHVNITTKWDYVRQSLTRASKSNTQTAGFITYLSAASGRFPYFFASGRSSPMGPALAYAHGTSCKDENRDKYYTLYHHHCTCENKERKRFCMLQYKGLNTLLYEWLNNGLDGHQQHPSEEYVFPQHLGIVLMDFPSNSLIRRLIDVNTAVAPDPPAASQRFPVCGKKCSCMAGDTLINTRDRGRVAASTITRDDLIESAEKDAWCKVLNTTYMDTGSVYGEFTEDHLLWYDNGTVLPNGDGSNATVRETELTNVFTECPAARTVNGIAFTPISTIFCSDALSGSEYTAMYKALMRIVKKTGTFWFDPSIYGNNFAYVANASDNGSAEDEVAGVDEGPQLSETFVMKLPLICKSLTTCAVNGTDCDVFEATAAQWMASHLSEEHYDVVKSSYPHLGLNATSGTLVHDVLELETPSDSDSTSQPDSEYTSQPDASGPDASDELKEGAARGKRVPLAAIIMPVVIGALLIGAVCLIIFYIYPKYRSRGASAGSPSNESHEPEYEGLATSPYYEKY